MNGLAVVCTDHLYVGYMYGNIVIINFGGRMFALQVRYLDNPDISLCRI